MDEAKQLYSALADYLPVLAVTAAVTGILWMLHLLLFRRGAQLGTEKRLPRQVVMLLLTGIGVVMVILALPTSDATRGQLLSLLGLLLSAIIALSSTTFVSNAMAGIMLRSVGSFHPGDFVRVGDHLGRVTERGLFHTEIQTEDRDLTTLPNLFLVSQPVTVVHASGTIVSTQLSLGYDIPRTQIEPLLIEAAGQAGLTEPFVQVMELGDYSVVYRIAGFLVEVKHLLTTRSNLCKQVLDTLHQNGIEIVSPTFMNQRVLPEGASIIPRRPHLFETRQSDAGQTVPEALIFDKADKAGKLEELRILKEALLVEIKTLEAQLGQADEAERASLTKKLNRHRKRVKGISSRLENGAKKD
ncbi:mechanosensitive ion channel family protein [Exilibacterium tricleocarpae]|uniref:Small-conductance mechanosensitive channel n=1 Tax=Exilibacterium tricleocarpae TaxID=2591008 RepID=A0A545TNK2_9GAMM|nr:mechanosensitive ion channel family protein [Exilibacterium tricleocarpae]TQV78794.1 mechanosensitive ion channel family protein [Exilibacterium tricleocarpae]